MLAIPRLILVPAGCRLCIRPVPLLGAAAAAARAAELPALQGGGALRLLQERGLRQLLHLLQLLFRCVTLSLCYQPPVL
jgi:hypothetical protein